VSFSINTNIASLQAQNYLRVGSNFQNTTINRVTSGLRIVNSGDDAAGLAIANGLRSDQAVLTQGIRNANDGLSTLQTIDGGMNNISQLLDRASTLATQSASSTFTGDRSVLNSEFQSVLAEINRQSQVIGLNTGGTFAKDLSVFIGGGTASGSTSAISNGSVSVDLTNATVDSQSLGLSGYSTTGNLGTDIGTGAGTTSVANIVADNTNLASEAQSGYTEFYFTGPGFTSQNGTSRVGISVNLSGVTDVNSLVTAVNAAIQSAGTGASQQATAFKNAGLVASVYTDSTGASHLRFTSSTSAFQVEAGDTMANALLGNVAQSGSANTHTGLAVGVSTAATAVAAGATAEGGATTVKLVISNGAGTNGGSVTASVSLVAGDNTAALVLAKVQAAVSGTGITASLDSTDHLVFTSGNATDLTVQATGDTRNTLGLGTFLQDGSGNTSYSSFGLGTTAPAAATQNVQIAIGGQVADLGSLTSSATENTALTNLNTALQGNALTAAAGLVAIDDPANAGKIKIVSTNGTNFRLNVYGASDGGHVGFGLTASDQYAVNSAAVATIAADTQAGTGPGGITGTAPSTIASGTSTSGFLFFNGISLGDASQTISLTAPDSSGGSHSISFSLSAANAGSVDQALSYINQQLLQSNDATLQSIVGVKQQGTGAYNATTNPNGNGAALGTNGISFVSSLKSFSVSVGTTSGGSGGLTTGMTTTNPTVLTQGIYTLDAAGTHTVQGGSVITSSLNGTGSTVDIASETNAETAVTAISNAVTTLGQAQAAVGKGENTFNYATNLAQSQLTNEAAAESRIRDADLAAEAANLSKAQILVQAGTAALAQANSAPQAILTLLRQ
jgi:flagellin